MPIRKADIGHRAADKELERIEKRLKKEYEEAYAELKAKADAYFTKYNKQIKKKMELVKAGKLSEADFIKWKKKEMLKNKRYDSLVRTLSQEMTKTNEMARDIVNGHLADVYAENYNYSAFEVCKDVGINLQFDLVDRRTVELLVKNEEILLPQASLNTIKDMKWNEQKIQSALFQGIVQGDSMNDIAKRLRKVSGMNEEASMRNARTMTTAAECQGRQDRYEEIEDKYGIKLKKVWLAVLDARTRDAHIELDGTSVAVNEAWENEFGKIRFPSDPKAAGANVYNCRCTMFTEIKGFPKDLSRREMGKGIEGMSYDEWKAEAFKRQEERKKKQAAKG